MINITANEPLLFLESRIPRRITEPRLLRVVIVVAPFRKVVCELETRRVGGCIFEVNNDELFVRVLREEERGRGRAAAVVGDEAENVAVLSL